MRGFSFSKITKQQLKISQLEQDKKDKEQCEVLC